MNDPYWLVKPRHSVLKLLSGFYSCFLCFFDNYLQVKKSTKLIHNFTSMVSEVNSVWKKFKENADLCQQWEICMLRMILRLLITDHADFLAQILNPSRCCPIKVWTEGKQWRGIFLLIIYAYTTNLLGQKVRD